MPKSKKNAKKSAQAKSDFKKPKVKLGKKIAPANQTKVEYKSRGINMSAQDSLMNEKEGVAVTRRRVTIDELFGQLKHYNISIRKDALYGLKELCGSHSEAICLRIREVLEATLKAVTDAERPVRHAVSVLYAKLLTTPPTVALTPFLKLIIMYTVQGLTHLRLDVRIDALRFLEVVLEQTELRAAAEAAIWVPLVASLTQMLSVALKPGGFSGNQKAATSPEVRAAVLRTMLALCGTPDAVAGAGVSVSHPASLEWSGAINMLHNQKLQWLLYRQEAGRQEAAAAIRISLPQAGLPLLVTEMMRAFEECAEATPQKAVHVEIMLHCLRLTAALASSCGTAFADAACKQIEKHVVPHVPFITVRPHTTRSALCCALCAAVASVTAECSEAAAAAKASIVDSTVDFIRDLLSESQGEGSIDWDDATHLAQILQSFSALTADLSMSIRISCLDSLVQLATRLHPQSRARSEALQSICKWVERVDPAPVQQLLAVLPKALWQLKGAHPETSSMIVHTLFHFASAHENSRSLLVNSLPPLMHAEPPNKSQAGTTRSVYGPVIKLAPAVQRRFLSILYYLPELNRATLRAVAALLRHKDVQPDVAEYAVEVVHSVRQRMAAEVYLSFAVSVVLNKATVNAASLRVVLCLQRLCLGHQLGESVMPLIAQVTQQPDTEDHQRVAAVRLIGACCTGCKSGESPVPVGAYGIVAQLLCKICCESTDVVAGLVMGWHAIWPSLLEELVRVGCISPESLAKSIAGLHTLMQVMEKMNGGPEVLAQYSEQLKTAGDKMVTEAGEAGSLAVQAGEVNALVQFVTN